MTPERYKDALEALNDHANDLRDKAISSRGSGHFDEADTCRFLASLFGDLHEWLTKGSRIGPLEVKDENGTPRQPASDLSRQQAIAANFGWPPRTRPEPVFRPLERGDHANEDPGDCLMHRDEFVADVQSGCFTDYDGYGELATETTVSNVSVSPSDLRDGFAWPAWATHVVWYNK